MWNVFEKSDKQDWWNKIFLCLYICRSAEKNWKTELKSWEAAQSVCSALRRWKTLTSERARGATSGEIGFPFWKILFFPFWQILLAFSSPLTPLTPSFEGGCTDNEWPPFFNDEKCSEEEGQAGDCWFLSLGGDEREFSWETPFASLR